jgi:hypothetical protein
MPVTETRASGLELLDTDVDEMDEDVDFTHFRTDEPIEIQVGQSAGNPVRVETQHFVAASVEQETDEMTQMMTGKDYIDESTVFISNEDGDVGAGLEDTKVDGGDTEDTLDAFEEKFL